MSHPRLGVVSRRFELVGHLSVWFDSAVGAVARPFLYIGHGVCKSKVGRTPDIGGRTLEAPLRTADERSPRGRRAVR